MSHYLVCLLRALHDGPPPEISAEVTSLEIHLPRRAFPLVLLPSHVDANELKKKSLHRSQVAVLSVTPFVVRSVLTRHPRGELTVAWLLFFFGGRRQQRVEVAVSWQCETAGFPSLGCHRDQPLHRHGQRDVALRREGVHGSGHHQPPAGTGLSKDGVLCRSEEKHTVTLSYLIP